MNGLVGGPVFVEGLGPPGSPLNPALTLQSDLAVVGCRCMQRTRMKRDVLEASMMQAA